MNDLERAAQGCLTLQEQLEIERSVEPGDKEVDPEDWDEETKAAWLDWEDKYRTVRAMLDNALARLDAASDEPVNHHPMHFVPFCEAIVKKGGE